MTRSGGDRGGQDRRFQKVATDFWFAVQRLVRRGDEPPTKTADFYPPGDGPPSNSGEDDGSAGSGVPRRPAPSAGSASAAADTEASASGDIPGH